MHVVIDIGGTRTRLAGAHDLGAFLQPVIFDTRQNYREALDALYAAAVKVSAGASIEDVAIGVPGVLSRDKRVLVHAPNLLKWNGAAIADDIEGALGARVVLENDTALVGLGEATEGAGKGSAILAYVTISTGVNGARIVDAQIDRATYGFEIGEQFVDDSTRTFEELVSGRAIAVRFNIPPRDLGKDHPIWDELARITARALHNAIAHWSPDRIVIGGSMMNEVGIPIDRIWTHLQALPRKNPALPEIAHATLGDFGGLWGGLARLRGERDGKSAPAGLGSA
ncbi:ROK family protein [Methylocystis sp.]|uniref:ROK family protein n=1 Tax=Methylocystis sp. TaxID=1911079 RepID=UPI0025E53062|nr:ROK family protein [Methylocystis sp.]